MMHVRSVLCGGLTLCAAATLPVTPAAGQSLGDRIAHVANQQQQRDAARQTAKAQALGALLYTDLTVQFDGTRVRDAINHLRSLLGINIIARYNDDRTGEGIDPETPITLSVIQTPALTVLEMILMQCEDDMEPCTWQLRDGFVEIGTKSRLASRGAQEIRFYPIRDLLFEPTMFDDAPDFDLDSALDQGNDQGGGGGGGGGFGGGGGGGGSGGGGSGGGSLFGGGASGSGPPRLSEEERAQIIIDLIQEIVEPDGWADAGGTWATMRNHQGTLIIRAPDFVHRQINGYPFRARPAHRVTDAGGHDIPPSHRAVRFSGRFTNVEVLTPDGMATTFRGPEVIRPMGEDSLPPNLP